METWGPWAPTLAVLRVRWSGGLFWWLMRRLHCIGMALAAALLASTATAQPAEGPASFRVFLKGSAIGGEDVTVRRTAAGITITSNGRLAAPLDLVTRQCVL